MPVQTGTIGNDWLVGGAGDDSLFGDQGNDRLDGGGGNDCIDGGFGTDLLDGGAGQDLVSFARSLTGVTVDLAGGWASDGLWRDRLSNFEGAVGSVFDDRLIGSAGADELLGNDGADVIDGGAGDDLIDGGQGDDRLTGGAGRDQFVHSLSDGNDMVTDFGADDRLLIFGYTEAQAIAQQGADVLVTLMDGDSVLVLNSDVGFVTARLTFDPQPRALLAGPVVAPLLVGEDLLVPAGVVVTSLNPLPLRLGTDVVADAATIVGRATLFNAGAIVLYSAGTGGDAVAVMADPREAPGSAGLVNLSGAVVEVHSLADGWGAFGIGQLFNGGLIDVVAERSAGGIVSVAGDNVPAPIVVNSGTIRVAGNLPSFGIGTADAATASAAVVVNSGTIEVRGAAGSAGIIVTAAAGATLVNSGTVRVVDADLTGAARGLLVNWTGAATVWNSGVVSADTAVALGGASLSGSARLTLVNTGLLDGAIDLRPGLAVLGDRRALSLLNSGTIHGDVLLGAGDDLVDSRLGLLVGNVSGGAGSDRLLAGAGDQSLDGGSGDDLLSGGAGNDLLTGGAGADRFRFETGFGRDTITDFDGAAGDRIEVRGYSGSTAMTQVGADVLITFTAGDELLVRNRLVADLGPSRFIFGASLLPDAVFPVAPAAPPLPLLPLAGTEVADTLIGHDFGDQLDGRGGNDVLSGGLGADRLSGGAGRDLFRDSLAGHDGDTITDFAIGDRLLFTDADPASFRFSLSGSTLTFSGGTLTFAAPLIGSLAASAVSGGGVQLVLAAPGPAGSLFAAAGAGLLADFNPAMGWTSQERTPRHVADVDGDGRADILGFGNAGVLVARGLAGSGFGGARLVLADFGQASGWTDDNRFHRAVGDVDGDGRADVLGFGYAGTLVALARADGTFGSVTTGVADFGVNQGWASQDGFARLVGDVNGDGRADLVGFGYAGALVALGRGDGSFAPVRLGLANFGVDQGWRSDRLFHRELADVNGDGAADLIGFGSAGTYVALARGDGSFGEARLTMADFGTAQGWSDDDLRPRLVADLNGDGLADILGFTNGGTLVAYGRGDGTFLPARLAVSDFGWAQGWSSDDRYHRAIADVDHDGRPDIVGFGIVGVLVGQNHADLIV